MKTWLCALLFVLPCSVLANERIVSIGGDVTEIVYALGASPQLIARDSTSLHPEAVTALPDVGYMRQLNAEGILSLTPSLVIASELSQPSLALKQIADSGIRVIMVPATPSLDSIPQKIAVIAQALHKETQGKALVDRYSQQIATVSTKPLSVKALFILSHGGMAAMAAGKNTPADTVIRAVGLKNAMPDVVRYQPLSQEGVIASAPDLLLISAQGVKSLGGEEKIWQLPGIALTPAGKQRRLIVVDDMAMLGFTLDTPALLSKLREAGEQVK